VTYRLLSLAIAQLLAAVAVVAAPGMQVRSQSGAVWTVPEIGALPRDAHGLQVREGRDLITASYAHIGPNVPDEAKRYAGNNLACSNCHLQAGTKKFGLPLFGLYGDFPQYSARSGDEISIEDRINSCMTRSMNGRPLPTDAPEMLAIVAYIKFLSSGVPSGQQLPGLGTGRMQELNRAADPTRGRPLYARICATCHEPDGSGVSYSLANSDLGYVDPPLWGAGSFNDGAGMARIITFANFIHFNMPHGTDYLDTRLSIEEGWDIAAFVLSQQRPTPASFAHDFPNLLLKPVDMPYGPYADHFNERQHKFGPFAPIRAQIKLLKKANDHH
jgi:thiosulfate dehydrogenase